MVAPGKLGPLRRKAKDEGWAGWIRSDHDERAMLAGCRFDITKAEHVRTFFERWLRHSKGEWAQSKFKLLDWQWEDLVAPTFGWLRENGKRRIRKVYCEIPKKNGKSTFGSGVGLYLLTGDGEGGAEVYSAATKRDQASIVHNEAINMVRSSPSLTKRLRINASTKVITFPATQSRYMALAADSAGSEGLNIHGLIVDELHAWKDRAFWDTLRYGFAARSQPLVFIITTAGVYDQTSLGWQEHDYAARWIAGEVEDNEFYGYIRAADKDEDLADPEIHRKANPSYEFVIDPAEIAKAAEDAKNKPSELYSFLRYRLNIWTDAAVAWLNTGQWDACASDSGIDAFEGCECYVALDLASKLDMTAMCVLFVGHEDGKEIYHAFFTYWVPRGTMSRRKDADKSNYRLWADGGHLQVTETEVTDYREVRRAINELAERFTVLEIAYDPFNVGNLPNELLDDGFEVVEFRQGIRSFNDPTKMLEAMIIDGTFRHDGNPISRWMAGNVSVRTDANQNFMPCKKTSTGKIDGMMAAIMCIGRASQSESGSIYEKESPIFI